MLAKHWQQRSLQLSNTGEPIHAAFSIEQLDRQTPSQCLVNILILGRPTQDDNKKGAFKSQGNAEATLSHPMLPTHAS